MLVEREQQFDQWKHAFLVTWPSATLGCPPFSQPGAFVLHLYKGGHDVGIFVPAAPSNLYHAVSIVLSHCTETFPYVTFLSALVMRR